MSWRMQYGIELLDAIDRDPGRVPSRYVKQFEKERTAFVRLQYLEDDGLIESHTAPSFRRTLTLTDKGRTVLDLCKKIERVMEADQ